jgi:amino acid adenylation domain-containing protein
MVAQSWAALLGRDRVGRDENFFRIGGHSLLATQVLSRVREVFGVEVALRRLFGEPTVAGLARSIEEGLRTGEVTLVPPIVAVSREGELPLSFAQQRLWFLDQFEPNSTVYLMQAALRLRGSLDLHLLERAFSEIIRRHEVLRTTFSFVDSQPRQVIAPPVPLQLPLINVSHLERAEAEEAARAFAAEEWQQPFDLSVGPLLRIKLLRLGEDDHVVVATMHHIISDLWSLGVMSRELAALYGAYSVGEESPLPELEIQYADYAHWQREWLQGEVLDEQLSYWREQLGDVDVLQLPTDRPRPPVQTSHGARAPVMISRGLADELKALSQRESVTLFMTLLAGFQTLLSRYTGQADIPVGTPIAGRTHAEIEPLIGFFVNTLVLRTDLSGDMSFRELLGRVREVALGAYAHQDVPFEKLVEELQPERSLSYSPLFQVMLVFQNTPQERHDVTGVELSPIQVEAETTKFDLTLHLTEVASGIVGTLQYNTHLFDATTISRIVGHFQRLLEAIVAYPEGRLSDLPLLTDEEQHQLLSEWNDTAVEYQHDRCIHELFEAWVEKTPEATALIFDDAQLTYAELNARANQLANHLRSKGVGPEVLVALCVERSLEMAVGLLGILKAGGAYVPLDPAYPQERLAFMLEDTAAPLLLTQQRLVAGLPPNQSQHLCLDTEWETIAAGQSAENLPAWAHADNRAYVIYTSGSTGRPKGVMVVHGGVCNLATAQARAFNLGPSDRVLQFASSSFDASVWEIFMALTAGATLSLGRRGDFFSGPALVELLREQAISTVTLPPAVLAVLAPEQMPELRTIIAAGESCAAETVARWGEGRNFFNAYGPTETTVCATMHRCAGSYIEGPPIGRPIANTQVYLLDAHLRPVPVGVIGELYVGGDSLARGYLNRPNLTAERFIPDPFSAGGARLYKTGDLARYLPDGEIEYAGRIDHQVKVRGYRIELGEIEAVLTELVGVREAIVIAREDVPGDKRLVAYVVAEDGQPPPTATEMRSLLRETLPDYMVPSAFMVLTELPLTPNGKINRRALPAPELTRAESEEEFVAPRTPFEEVLTGIWAELLRVERVGVKDNFFQLGGHSLLATQLVSRVRETFQVEISLRRLFEGPTVSGLALAVEEALHAGERVPSPPVTLVSRDGNLPLSFAQQRLWFLDQLEPGSAAYNMPLAVRLTGQLEREALERAFAEILRRHEVLRTTFHTTLGRPVQVINAEQALALPLLDLSQLPADEREAEMKRLATEEARLSFDLSTGPLLRVQLLRLSGDEHLLLLTLHHIIADGWSMSILTREVAALYRAFDAGESGSLPELPLQYADYAAWQREWLQGEALDEQLQYWREQLSDAPSLLELPTDRPRPPVQTQHGARRPIRFSASLSQQLEVLSRRESVTMFMTLLAAFQALLARYSGQQDVLVGTPIAGRTRAEVEPLIGLFVNTLVLRARMDDNPSFRQLLAQVREAALGAYAHQDVPFEMLVEELQPERALSHTPLFQVMFMLQNVPLEATELSELSLSLVAVESGTTKFDLTLSLRETGEGIYGSLEYNTDLFDEETITLMVEHYERLLDRMVRDPEHRVREISLLSESQRAEVLFDWNQRAAEYPQESCIHQLFQAQVARTPEAVAVSFAGNQLSYLELNRRANQLAHHLRSLGVTTGSHVAICLDHSIETVVCILGVLKAGAAYLPLDPQQPPARLTFMLADAKSTLLLTQQHLGEHFSNTAAQLVCIDTQWDVIAQQSSQELASANTSADTAYLIYTSGSTGEPKAVIISHRSLVNYIYWAARVYLREERLSFALYSSLAFDLTVTSIFTPLVTGNTLFIYSAEDGVPSLLQILDENTVGVLKLTPSHLSLLKDRNNHESSVKRLIVGGESLMTSLAREVSESFGGDVEIYNEYGPTEATVGCMIYQFDPEADVRAAVSIGVPAANAEIYLLDEEMEPVAENVLGEIYIGGDGLAQGYWQRAEMTAERFVPDPFSPDGGARLYRTGDIGRRLRGGDLEYVGRLDEQVKVRGYRIELGEIESVINAHAQVKETLVTAREDDLGEKRLVAYVVGNGEEEVRTDELRSYLKERLPEYMLPAAFVVLAEIPLTPNGKVNYRALPEPELIRPELQQNYVAPRTPTEERLTTVFSEVLGIEGVGIEDNFFELGGHSLLATQVISRVREAFNIEVPLRRIFEQPSVAGLAVVIAQSQAEQANSVEIAQMLAELDQLSDDEVQSILAGEAEPGD